MNSYSVICPDAGLVVRLLLNHEPTATIVTLWREWYQANVTLVAPHLLFYEVSNVLHQYVRHGHLKSTEAETGIQFAFRLGIEAHSDVHLHRQALMIGQQWQLPAAYDAHYLALAERFGGHMLTTDERLYQAVSPALEWVHLWQP